MTRNSRSSRSERTRRDDAVSPARRRNMAAIGPKNTKPEIVVRRALHAAGLRFRLHKANLPGRPDITLRRHNAIIYVQGCFWHHHGCRNSVWPVARAAFWRKKIKGNMARDRRNFASARALGWRVFVIWECETTKPTALAKLARSICSGRGDDTKRMASRQPEISLAPVKEEVSRAR